MSIEFELLEKFTGKRDGNPCTDVMVRFKYKDVVHERAVNVCFNDKGKYDKAATMERIEQVGNGVMSKINAGVIAPAPPTEEGNDTPE